VACDLFLKRKFSRYWPFNNQRSLNNWGFCFNFFDPTPRLVGIPPTDTYANAYAATARPIIVANAAAIVCEFISIHPFHQRPMARSTRLD
jgi:hypothetical protein